MQKYTVNCHKNWEYIFRCNLYVSIIYFLKTTYFVLGVKVIEEHVIYRVYITFFLLYFGVFMYQL